MATEHPHRDDYECTETSMKAGAPLRYLLVLHSRRVFRYLITVKVKGFSSGCVGIGSFLTEDRGMPWECVLH